MWSADKKKKYLFWNAWVMCDICSRNGGSRKIRICSWEREIGRKKGSKLRYGGANKLQVVLNKNLRLQICQSVLLFIYFLRFGTYFWTVELMQGSFMLRKQISITKTKYLYPVYFEYQENLFKKKPGFDNSVIGGK